MLSHHLKVALRNQRRHPVYAAINLFGLVTGLSCALLLGVLVAHELGFDRFHADGERIYRLVRQDGEAGQERFSERTSGPLATGLAQVVPEVELATRIEMWGVFLWVGDGAAGSYCRVGIADSNALRLFSFPVVEGTPATALSQPYQAVLTRATAERIFGERSVLGRTVTVDERNLAGEYEITAVIDVPDESSLSYDVLIARDMPGWDRWLSADRFRPVESWVRLRQGADPEPVAAAAIKLSEAQDAHAYHLQPLHRLHLHSSEDYGLHSRGSITYIQQLSMLAAFLLLLACVNFVNLATARSALRAREVGVRKTVGAPRSQLTGQFVLESVALVSIATGVAVAVVEAALPAFGAFTERQLDLPLNPGTVGTLLLLAGTVGLLAGLYPALILSAFEPGLVLRRLQGRASGLWLRRGLVVFQFSVSIGLIAATAVVERQMSYLHDRDLGFQPQRFVTMPIFWRDFETVRDPARRLSARYQAVKSAVAAHTGVVAVTAFRNHPGTHGGDSRHQLAPATGEEPVRTRLHVVDEDFVDVYGLQVIAGHNLADSAADRGQGLLINETLAARLGWSPQDAVGQALRWNDRREATVVGVLRDFHNRSLHEPIGPVALSYDESRFLRLGVRLGPGRLAESLGHLEEVWHRFQPDRPFGVSFLDDDLASLYRREQRLGEVTAVFSTLAVIVATLGLVGLVSFLAERKTREHGIRKVLGASVADVVTGLSREFAILVLLSNLIAWPVAWWLMSTWLGGFAYRVTLGPGVFVGAGAIGLAIAIGSVAYRAYTAATANPVDALRCE